MNRSLKDKILDYSVKYYNDFLKPLEPKRERMLEDPKEALYFFFDRVFYQGRQNSVSDRVRDEAKAAIEEFERERGDFKALFDLQNHGRLRELLSLRIGKGKVGRKLDKDLVISLLEFGAKVKGNNLVSFLKDNFQRGRVRSLFLELQKIRGIGPKISSFILRDFSVLYGLDQGLSDDDYVVLQPIDVWVRKVGVLLGLYKSTEETDKRIRIYIVDYCISQKLSPPRFNQGMWYYGFSERPRVSVLHQLSILL